jgi:hypothetical protein
MLPAGTMYWAPREKGGGGTLPPLLRHAAFYGNTVANQPITYGLLDAMFNDLAKVPTSCMHQLAAEILP